MNTNECGAKPDFQNLALVVEFIFALADWLEAGGPIEEGIKGCAVYPCSCQRRLISLVDYIKTALYL